MSEHRNNHLAVRNKSWKLGQVGALYVAVHVCVEESESASVNLYCCLYQCMV